ncbi:hypothetical protein FRC02_004255 [Tulasnella sp. 418]|nr:hypothetical protein FRC02_004255 [Tulasnella sp. 418]
MHSPAEDTSFTLCVFTSPITTLYPKTYEFSDCAPSYQTQPGMTSILAICPNASCVPSGKHLNRETLINSDIPLNEFSQFSNLSKTANRSFSLITLACIHDDNSHCHSRFYGLASHPR